MGRINKKGPLELFAQKNKENIKNGDAVPEQIRDDIGAGMTARNCAGGTKKKGPPERLLRGPVNPAATYSPGPGGQVPSAI